jgi:hypothetical protein
VEAAKAWMPYVHYHWTNDARVLAMLDDILAGRGPAK